METQEYRLVVESLRSGVPSRRVAGKLPMGREDILSRISDEIEALGSEGTRAYFIQGNYGEGKTHLLHAIWDLAARTNCVVSFVILSKETPFDRLHQVYPKVIANTYLPNSTQPGVDQLLLDVHPSSSFAVDLLAFAQDELHPRLALVLRNYFWGKNVEIQQDLVQDLSGNLLPAQDLKAIHRLNFGQAAHIGRFSKTRDIWDYYRLIDVLVALRKYRGWVLLFDEAELIGKLGLGSRARAYSNLARFLSPAGGLSRALSVFAFANSFYSDVLGYKDDGQRAAEWFAIRGDYEAAEAVITAQDAIRGAERLPSLTSEQLHEVMEQLVEAHARAYSWTPPTNADHLFRRVLELLPHPDTKLRTRVRTAIHWLDHLLQYSEDPTLGFSSLSEIDLMEEEELAGDEAAATLDSTASKQY